MGEQVAAERAAAKGGILCAFAVINIQALPTAVVHVSCHLFLLFFCLEGA